jgi:hypothetical protein
VRAVDAICPHRGAHLGHGGRLHDDSIVCPFHGYQIRIGQPSNGQFFVCEHEASSIAGLIFVRTSGDRDNGCMQFLREVCARYHIVNGFQMPVQAAMEMVIDNACDQRHFHSVHGVRTGSFEVSGTAEGALLVDGEMHLPVREAGTGRFVETPAPFRALIFSPGLAAVELGGATPYMVITGATAAPLGGCIVRLTLAFPRTSWITAPPATVYEPLLEYSRRGLEMDRVIWENISPSVEPRWTPEDHASLRFLSFCEAHRDDGK